jgi:hypothetical protein
VATPTINPVVADSSTAGGHYLVPHKHNFNSIVGLRFGTNGRVEPVYDAVNVYANGVLIALYNAASTGGASSPPAVPFVTVTSAVQNVEGDDNNTLGKEQADRFLAEGRITAAEYKQLTTTPVPKTEGVKASPPKKSQDFSAVTAGISMEMVLTPKGTTLAQMIKNVTFPRTIPQLAECHPSVAGPTAVINNLAALAQNCIEPIKAKYPNTLVTNSYRHGSTIGGGQHGTGQACDLQFRGVPAHNYFEIAKWIEQNIPYDQLLLEYLPSKTVWVHMSFALPNLPYGGLCIRKSKPGNILATLNGAAGGKFQPNLHADIIQAAVPNRIVAA